MSNITYAELDENLREDLGDDYKNFQFYEFWRGGQYDNSFKYHVAYSQEDARGGIVHVGQGCNGLTSWTDATGPEDALDKYLNDEML